MSLRLIALVVAVMGAIGGCGTPSVHPVYSKDKEVTEPGLVGVWRYAEKSGQTTTFEVSQRGGSYRLLVKSNDPKDPKEWAFEVHLAQLGKFRFADFAPPDDERKKLDEKWGPLFVPTHLFARYAVDGDRLRVWLPNRERLANAIEDKKVRLASTKLGDEVLLITAETADLQKFLEKHAEDKDLFDVEALERVNP